MTIAQFIPIDHQARRAISEQLDETLFVEASAGTGKTTSLVARVVNLVASGRATLDRIAAITFTEAAAAELRDRIRQDLEKAAASASRSDVGRARCRQGVADLDQASIQTLHSFASALLHERPLEAGLPPGFETTDEIAAGLKFDDAWDEWLDKALDEKSPVAAHLAVALSLGLTLSQLKDIAKSFHKNYNDLYDADFGLAGKAAEAGVGEGLVVGIEGLLDLCVNPDAGDRLYDYLQGKLEEAQQAAAAGNDPVTLGYMVGRMLPFRLGGVGTARNWPEDYSPKDVRDALKQLEIDVRRMALMPVLGALRQFVLEYSRQRRREGRAEFHDLLVWAGELLRDDIEVRDHFRDKFTHLLIDESQDTDPLQTEIALLLAEDNVYGNSSESRPVDWREINPRKGKLFVVGDPKQSIYRFRRADVTQMQRLRGKMGGCSVSLTQNFRSQRPVTEWVNHLFSRWMSPGQDGVQAAYENMFHRWEGNVDHALRPRVWALGDEEIGTRMVPLREQEASEIALLLRRVVAEPWQVLDREKTDEQGFECYRAVTYADICLLMPARTALRQLETSLENAGIPYRLENASLIFATQEIRDLTNCLRAIDDPADQIATVAALRSPAFGCSDADLFGHRSNGGSFNYLHPQTDPADGPVGSGLMVLREFHRQRMWHPIAFLIDRFIRQRSLMESALVNPRTREQWRRYRFVVEQARRFSDVVEPARNSLRAFLEWMDNQAEENARISETPVPEEDEDAVRVMTVHAAKGLEFPIVLLTGINSGRSNRGEAVLFDRNDGRVEVGVGPAASRFATHGYERLLEREHHQDYAERVRLMYVAATRARDHLIVSLRRQPKSQNGNGTLAHEISKAMESAPDLWEAPSLAGSDTSGPQPAAQDVALLDHSLEARDAWGHSRKSVLESAGHPSFVAATALGRSREDEKPEAEAAEPWRRGRAGTSVGRALHAVMQSADLAAGSDLQVWSRAFVAAEGIPEREAEVARLARRAIDSPVVRRAVNSGRYWREVPVAIPIALGSLQGFIDLMFEEDGQLVVVDYKTDSLGDGYDSVGESYRMQGAAYALALQQSTGMPVKEVIFLFPREEPAVEVPLTGLNSLAAEAEKLAMQTMGAVSE